MDKVKYSKPGTWCSNSLTAGNGYQKKPAAHFFETIRQQAIHGLLPNDKLANFLNDSKFSNANKQVVLREYLIERLLDIKVNISMRRNGDAIVNDPKIIKLDEAITAIQNGDYSDRYSELQELLSKKSGSSLIPPMSYQEFTNAFENIGNPYVRMQNIVAAMELNNEHYNQVITYKKQ